MYAITSFEKVRSYSLFCRWISGAALDGEIHPARDARYVSLLVA